MDGLAGPQHDVWTRPPRSAGGHAMSGMRAPVHDVWSHPLSIMGFNKAPRVHTVSRPGGQAMDGLAGPQHGLVHPILLVVMSCAA